MLIVTSQQEIDAYYESSAVSRSDLMLLDEDLHKFVQSKKEVRKKGDESNVAFKIGGGVDCMLTAESHVFDEKYAVSSMSKMPSEAIMNIVARVHQQVLYFYDCFKVVNTKVSNPTNGYGEYVMAEQDSLVEETPIPTFPEFAKNLGEWGDLVLESRRVENWQPTWKDEVKILDNIIKAGGEYFLSLCANYGQIVLTTGEYDTIKRIVNSLKTNPRTAPYFDRVNQAQTPEVDVYLQPAIYFSHRGVSCRALLDMLFIFKDSQGNLISVLPVDIKTMSGNTLNFHVSLRKRRYDIQAAWYTLAVGYFLMKNYGVNLPKKYLRNFEFVVESSTSPGKPLVYSVAESLLQIGVRGRVGATIDGVQVSEPLKGYSQLLDKYIYHSNSGWEEEQEIRMAGVLPITLSWEGITNQGNENS